MFSGQFYEMRVSVRERLLGTVTCISVVETSNCIIATETVTYIIATERSTNITVTESTTCIGAVEPQDLHNCNRRCQLHK